jgi:hypothetical protein
MKADQSFVPTDQPQVLYRLDKLEHTYDWSMSKKEELWQIF